MEVFGCKNGVSRCKQMRMEVLDAIGCELRCMDAKREYQNVIRCEPGGGG